MAYRMLLTLTFGLLAVSGASAQSCYKDNRGDGLKFKQRGDYVRAVRCFRVALSCPDKPRNNDLNSLILSCQKAMAAAKKNSTSSQKTSSKPTQNQIQKPKVANRFTVDGNTDDLDLDAKAGGGWKTFKVESPNGTFKVESSIDWCVVSSKNANSFRIDVSENSNPRARVGQLIVTSGNESITLFVSQEPNIPEWNPSGTVITPTGTAAEMPLLIGKLKSGLKCRVASITSNRRGIVVSDNCQFFCTDEVPQPLKDKLLQIQQHGDRLNSVSITGSGYYCITWDKNSWFGKVTDAMKNKIREFVAKDDELLNVSISDDGNFTILTDKHVYASRQSDLDFIIKAEKTYGDSKCITISTRGICVVCEYGIAYNNVPVQLGNRLKAISQHPDYVTFTDSGTYFMSDDKGWFDYDIR